jgi:hypothetical protein
MDEKREKMKKIELMKKISLELRAGTSDQNMDMIPQYPLFEFVFGLGPEGMTPFEYELLDRKEGEEVVIPLRKQEYDTFFEHLQPPIMDLFDGREQVFLNAKIVWVTTPENREVIKAMAQIAEYREGACGCGCGCGCST